MHALVSTVIRLLVYCRAGCYPRGLFDYVLNMCCSCFVFRSRRSHQRSQDFCWGGGTRPTPPSLAPVVHKCEAVAGSWGSVSAPSFSRVMGGAPEGNTNSNKWGRVFVNVVSLKYIGMIYIIVGEMCFIPMNVHNELVFVSSNGNTFRL